MKAITEIAPWATAIIHLGKDVENRSWAPPRWLVGQRIAIHQGKRLDEDALFSIQLMCKGEPTDESVVTSAIIGTVYLAGFVYRNDNGVVTSAGLSKSDVDAALASRWRAEHAACQWVLRWPVALKEPIKMPGKQGLWDVPAEHVARLREGEP